VTEVQMRVEAEEIGMAGGDEAILLEGDLLADRPEGVVTTAVVLLAVVVVIVTVLDHLGGTEGEGAVHEQAVAAHLDVEGEVFLQNEGAGGGTDADVQVAVPVVLRGGVLGDAPSGLQDEGIIVLAAAVEVARIIVGVEGGGVLHLMSSLWFTKSEMKWNSRCMAAVVGGLDGSQQRWMKCAKLGCMGRRATISGS